jgi:hypothetical protein
VELLIVPKRFEACKKEITKLELAVLDRYLSVVSGIKPAGSYIWFHTYP